MVSKGKEAPFCTEDRRILLVAEPSRPLHHLGQVAGTPRPRRPSGGVAHPCRPALPSQGQTSARLGRLVLTGACCGGPVVAGPVRAA